MAALPPPFPLKCVTMSKDDHWTFSGAEGHSLPESCAIIYCITQSTHLLILHPFYFRDSAVMDGRVAVGVLWAVATGVAVGAMEELTCQNGCRCWIHDPQKELEYRVICRGTPNQTVALTEAVFRGSRPDDEYKTYVRIDGPSTLLVTEGFIQRWRKYYSCVLDVWSVQDLRLPHTTPFLPHKPTPWKHVFAGMGLVDVNVDSIPSGLFSGKESAGLRLTRSSVGRISTNLLRHVESLKFLKVRQSNVGLFEGPLGSEQLKFDSYHIPVQVEDSTIGRLGKGALRLRAKSSVHLVIQDTVFGELSAESLDLFGPANLVIDGCQVAHLTQRALSLRGEATLTLTNSIVSAESEGLSDFPCSVNRSRIYSNRLFVLTPNEGHVGLGNRTEDLDLGISTREVLETVLHPTCVENNLLQPRDHWPSETILYSFAALAVLVITVLVCLLVRRRPPGRPRNSLSNQTVVMSQLNDDSLYEEPSFLQNLPAVPPPCILLQSNAAKMEAQSGAACSAAPNSCCGTPFVPTVVENDYMKMH